MSRSWGIVWTALIPFVVGSGPPVIQSATPAPELDALFNQADGWIGGDGAYSVALSPKRILWLFSDSWIGKIRDGHRTDATIVNNTIGMQAGPGEHATFGVARSPDGKPKALIVPTDGRGWFWLQAGVTNGNRLLLFLNQVEKTDKNSVFGFRSVGLWLGIVANSDRSPDLWRVEQVKMPNAVFSDDRTLVWGAAALRVGDGLYVYGTDEKRGNRDPNRRMVVALVPAASVSNFATWRYYRDGAWIEDFRNASPLASDIASDYSVIAFENRYLAVYTERGLSSRIMGRLADHPWGPWSAPAVVYECPEMRHDRKVFCYGAKAHPALSSGRTLVVSYVVNSFDFWQVARESRLYWPRFVRVRLVPS
jgi:Domain of unknown function (DUF4185)